MMEPRLTCAPLFLEGKVKARYLRNFPAISEAEQHKLSQSKVVLVGLGGLGGFVLEQLARLGVGEILACDPDVFEKSNLNRQLLSTEAELGQSKATLATKRVQQINSSLNFRAIAADFSEIEFRDALVLDALGGAKDRLRLEEATKHLTLVACAVSGFSVVLATKLPGQAGLGSLLAKAPSNLGAVSTEEDFGTPVMSVAFAASLQVAEAVRILVGQDPLLAGKLLLGDISKFSLDIFPLPN